MIEVRTILESLIQALPAARSAALYAGPDLLLGGLALDQFVLNAVPGLWVRTKAVLRSGFAVYIPAGADLVAESPFRLVESLAMFPIFHRRRLVGFLYLDSDQADFLPEELWRRVSRILEPLGLITRLSGVKERRHLRRRRRFGWRRTLRDLMVGTLH
jgi:hypothetical protein